MSCREKQKPVVNWLLLFPSAQLFGLVVTAHYAKTRTPKNKYFLASFPNKVFRTSKTHYCRLRNNELISFNFNRYPVMRSFV